MAKVKYEAKTLSKAHDAPSSMPYTNSIVLSVLAALVLIWAVIKWRKVLQVCKSLVFIVWQTLSIWAISVIFATVISCVPYYAFKLIMREDILRVARPIPFLVGSGEGGFALGFALLAWWLVAFFGVFVSVIAIFVKRETQERKSRDPQEHVRGRTLISYEDAVRRAAALLGSATRFVFFGFLRLAEETANTHISITGVSGSGKTILIRLLMQSVLPEIVPGSDKRAIVYDAKQDIVSHLYGMGVSCPIKILNPFDTRSVAWDMAKDITAPATAHQIASILIPEVKGETQPFFNDTARDLLTGIFISLINTSTDWTFKDVLLATRSEGALRAVLSRCSHTRSLPDQYLTEERTAQNIFSTLSSKLKRYEFIAAAWEKATEKLSLLEFLSSEMILVLGNDESTRSALDAINQLIFKRLTELILSQSESRTRRTWLFLDEIREAGKLEGLPRLLTKGRSKGASVILGFQDIEGLRDVYGHDIADELVGQCANKALLRVGSPETARWASALLGDREVLEIRSSTSESESSGHSDAKGMFTDSSRHPGSVSSGKTTNTSTSEQITNREIVLKSEFLDLPFPGPEGFYGYFIIPAVGAYKAHMNFNWVLSELREPGAEPNFIARAASDQYLEEPQKIDAPTPAAPAPESPTKGSLEGIGE